MGWPGWLRANSGWLIRPGHLAWTENLRSEVSCWPRPGWHTAARDFRYRLFVSEAWR